MFQLRLNSLQKIEGFILHLSTLKKIKVPFF